MSCDIEEADSTASQLWHVFSADVMRRIKSAMSHSREDAPPLSGDSAVVKDVKAFEIDEGIWDLSSLATTNCKTSKAVYA